MFSRSLIAFRKAQQQEIVPADTAPAPTISGAVATTIGPSGVTITGTGFRTSYKRPLPQVNITQSVYLGTTSVPFVVDSATQITATGTWNGTDTIVVNTQGGCGVLAIGLAFHLLTEASLGLLTEAGDSLRTE